MRLHLARWSARFGPNEELMLLRDQDRSLWDRDGIARRNRPRRARDHLFHAVRGRLLVDLGERGQARAAELEALSLTRNPAERALLEERAAAH
jgi:predicted RNA polymerase sigma factor